MDQELQKAAESVAKAVPGRQSEVKSNLLQQLKSYALLSKRQAEGQPPPDVAAKVRSGGTFLCFMDSFRKMCCPLVVMLYHGKL